MIPADTGDAHAISLIESIIRSRGAIAPELIDARTIEALARARCAAGAAASVGAYARMLQADPHETDRLIAEIAVPETWFFRYPGSFGLLRTLLAAQATDPSRHVRILSVGCAGGCEPVSIAVTALSAGIAPERLEVIAVDRNPQAVRDAESGRWPAHALREGLPEWSAPWMRASIADERIGGAAPVEVDASVRGRIRWRIGDAMAQTLAEPGSCAAVFCRNVLIYLDAAARDALLARLIGALAPDGVLFLGHAESMVGRAGLESAGVPGAFAWRVAAVPREVPPAQVRGPSARRPVRRTADAGPAMREPAPGPPVRHPAASPNQRIAAAQGALMRGDAGTARVELLNVGSSISRGDDALHADDMELAAGLLCSVGELDAAFDLYSRIAFVNPSHDRALLAMAELAESCGRTDEATRLRERLRRLAARQSAEDRP